MKVKDFIQIVGMNRLSIIPYDGCIHWNKKKPCKFCDANPKKEGYSSPVPTLNTLNDFENSKKYKKLAL